MEQEHDCTGLVNGIGMTSLSQQIPRKKCMQIQTDNQIYIIGSNGLMQLGLKDRFLKADMKFLFGGFIYFKNHKWVDYIG